MANYYHLTGWRKTGFDFLNRPESPDVLASDAFTNDMFQLDGIMINRSDMLEIRTLKIQGSVKDVRGSQINDPNSTGSHGKGGPFYSLEEVDYIRLVRTGYPGDDDYVDISGHEDDPQNTLHEGAKLNIAYYFVVGIEPLARNVTRLYLALDAWLTCGGSNELMIESGFKIAGHITDAEDATSYNLSPAPIGLLSPLEIQSSGVIDGGWAASGNYNIIASAVDLSNYEPGESADAYVARAASGQTVTFPKVFTVTHDTRISLVTPTAGGQETGEVVISDYGLFNADNVRIQNGLSLLYSAGQLELQDSYSIPRAFLSASESASGIFNDLRNVVKEIPCPVAPVIGGYPRKADYMYAQYVLYSQASGNMISEDYTQVSNPTVLTWAIPTPSGSPIARFKKIKGHEYPYDHVVKGMQWIKKSVIMQGAAGSLWTQVSYDLQTKQSLVISTLESINNKHYDQTAENQALLLAGNAAIAAGSLATQSGSVENLLSGGKYTWKAASEVLNTTGEAAQMVYDNVAEQKAREQRITALKLQNTQNFVNYKQAMTSAPYVDFVPDLSVAMFRPNTFGVYVVNASARDRERLRTYFSRYGYTGLYKPLSRNEILVKQNVNYIKCETVTLRHTYYPMRMLAKAAEVLQDGVFLWAVRPDQTVFTTNPDRVNE